MTLEAPAAEDEIFKISRTFDAPQALFWDVCTQAGHLAEWFGPAGMKLIVKSLDFKPGGTFLYGMQMPPNALGGGVTMWGKWVFREIEAPSRMAYVVSFCNEAGDPVRHPMAPLWPLEVLAIQTLTPVGDKTLFESRSYPINATPEERAIFKAGHASMQMGFTGTYMQLDAYLAKLGK